MENDPAWIEANAYLDSLGMLSDSRKNGYKMKISYNYGLFETGAMKAVELNKTVKKLLEDARAENNRVVRSRLKVMEKAGEDSDGYRSNEEYDDKRKKGKLADLTQNRVKFVEALPTPAISFGMEQNDSTTSPQLLPIRRNEIDLSVPGPIPPNLIIPPPIEIKQGKT